MVGVEKANGTLKYDHPCPVSTHKDANTVRDACAARENRLIIRQPLEHPGLNYQPDMSNARRRDKACWLHTINRSAAGAWRILRLQSCDVANIYWKVRSPV